MTSQNQNLPATVFENYEPNQYYKDIETALCHLKI